MNWTPSTTTPGSLPAATTDSTQLQKEHHASLASFYSSIALLPSTPSANSPSSLQDHENHGDVGSSGGDKIERGSKGGKPPVVILTGLTEYEVSDSKEEGLLVFGYGCKVFRDDERAQWIEDDKHLIPWMGDKQLLIDRYDCRGALMDIGRYEPGGGIGGGGSGGREGEEGDFEGTMDEEDEGIQGDAEWHELNEERYRDLNEEEDYDDDAQYERLKRAMNGMVSESHVENRAGVSKQYAAFQYDYNEKNHDICIGPEPKRLHDEDSPYVKPVGLYIPEEIALPKTTKNHAIIEKTAKFIASQGNQMEIILKTKQAKNPLFDFLNHSGTLNPYYKFMVHAIRTGIFRPPAEDVDVANSSQGALHDCSGSEEDADHTYLHPSLFRTSSTMSSSIILDSLSSSYPSSSIPTSQSSRHNAYSMLVSKIKGTDSPDPQQTGFMSSSQTTSTAGDYLTQTTNSVYNTYGYKVPPVTTPQQQNPPPTPQKQIPSTQDQLIIEKMASYVIKNGANFEVLAKNKEDHRFGFLKPSHEYHWYYLNCKERFKAESSAVVASSDFVTYGSTNATPSSSTVSVSASTSSSVKKSATAELAEMKRKNLSPTKKDLKDKSGSGNNPSSTSGAVPAESVFSQANLVKEKDKPVIRFSSTLSLTTFPNNGANTGATGSSSDIQSETEGHLLMPTKGATKSNTPSPQRFPISPVTINSADDDVECVSPFEEAGEGNTTPGSDDEEQLKRRMERKRKATLFLAKLKSKHSELATATATVEVAPQRKEEQNIPAAGYQSKDSSSSGSTLVTGSSLGDLLSRRLQETNQERLTVPISIKRESPGVDDDGDDYNGMKSSSSSRHSSRSRSRSHVPSSRRSRRSYSSSSNSSSYGSGTAYSKKKSSKRKHKKKKKKHEKSSRTSSRKSKRRK